MNKKVCVLIVTYNRKEYLVKTIEALLGQTRKPEKILIFDNNSSDGTCDYLSELGYIGNKFAGAYSPNIRCDIEIEYYLNGENEGGSGGFHKGIQMAMNYRPDYIWAMDDDVLPDDKCLELLLGKMSDKNRICIPSRNDANYTDYAITAVNMSNPFLTTVESRKKMVKASDIDSDSIAVQDMPFEGPLISTDLIKEIGLPLKELFIFYDDSEYAYRASLKTEILYVKDAILHKQIIPSASRNRLMGWRAYYAFRNQYWFDRKYGNNAFVKYLRPLMRHLDLCIRAIIRRKWTNLRVLRAAYYDGTRNLLGKRVNPGTEFNWNKTL